MDRILKSEKKIRNKEHGESAPHSVKGFEKSLLASPNCSFLWIKYAAFALGKISLEKAREILQRASKHISPTEEKEKLNIFIAMINLENAYGTEESFEKISSEAALVNDPEKILKHKIKKILEKNDLESAEFNFQVLCRKFGKNIKNWEQLLEFYIKTVKDEDKFNSTLRRAMQALKDNIEIRKTAAILEYNYGSPEKGRTYFEGILAEKTKRSDIWGVYLSLEAKHNTIEQIRDLYERALSLKLYSKALSNLAYQYYQYEFNNGSKVNARKIADKFNIKVST